MVDLEELIKTIEQELSNSSSCSYKCEDGTIMGSGTTGRVANSLNRRWIGFEINKEFCEMSNNIE